MPDAASSSARVSRWKRSSSSSSRSNSERRKRNARRCSSSRMASDRPHDELNRADHAVELAGFLFELFAAFGRQPVKPRLAIVFRNAPLGLEPAFDEHTVEGGVEGPVLDGDAV